MNWVKRHWRGILSGACGVASVGLIPLSPLVAGAVAASCGVLAVTHVLDARALAKGRELGELGKAARDALERKEQGK